jgi:putative DNA primase/helicase
MTKSPRSSDDLTELRAGLVTRSGDLAVALLGEPNPKIKGIGELRWRTHGSFSVKGGVWRDHETNEAGDLLALIMRERRCSFADSVKYAREFCGIRRARAQPRVISVEDNAARSKFALDVFRGAGGLDHPIAQRYLARRELTLPDGVDGPVLRFHQACPFGPGAQHPAIVALYRGILDNEARAISRTALTAEGEKIDRKMLGPIIGTACKLTADEDVTLGLHIAEGLETGLAAMMLGFVPLWVLGSAGAIRNFPLFEDGFECCLTIICDNDRPNPKTGRTPGQDAARVCSDRWTLAGQEVRRVLPAMLGEDMNDVVRRRQHNA